MTSRRRERVALVPGIAVEPEIARGELVAVPAQELKLRIAYRKGGQLSHARLRLCGRKGLIG